jgi:hypothetical protein
MKPGNRHIAVGVCSTEGAKVIGCFDKGLIECIDCCCLLRYDDVRCPGAVVVWVEL